jgi:carboxylate-amine ligase
VRPHPTFGTVEIRVCDGQTRLEHTLALTALIQAMVHELAAHHDDGTPLGDVPWQILDENKYLAAIHGLEGELIDLPSSDRVRTKELARRLVDRLRPHAQELGSEDALEGIVDLVERGTGGDRQVLVYDANSDLTEVMAEMTALTATD